MGDLVHWLAGRVAVVTGASRGIGAATAQALAAAGAQVVLAARDREALDGVTRQIRQAGGKATPVPTDVSKAANVERLVHAAGQVGPLAAMVCAAGVLTPAPFAETTQEIWEETLAVNLTGAFLYGGARRTGRDPRPRALPRADERGRRRRGGRGAVAHAPWNRRFRRRNSAYAVSPAGSGSQNDTSR